MTAWRLSCKVGCFLKNYILVAINSNNGVTLNHHLNSSCSEIKLHDILLYDDKTIGLVVPRIHVRSPATSYTYSVAKARTVIYVTQLFVVTGMG